jgi:hypothetical protein
MQEAQSMSIVPIAFYCFGLGIYFLSLAINLIFGNTVGLSITDVSLWLMVMAFIVLMGGLVAIGIGILHLKPLSWKILLFSLLICITSIAAFLAAYVVLLLTNLNGFFPFFQMIPKISGGWIAFLSFFLSEIIILYYLGSHEVVSCFGDMGPLISPF